MQAQNASLIFNQHNATKHVVLLPGGEVFFGRDKTNDVKLALFPLEELAFQWATADISRRHFVIRRGETNYTIQDFGSTNGTSVDCIALLSREILLQQNQIIDVGGVLDLMVGIRKGSLCLHRLTNTPEESYLIFSDFFTIGSSEECTIPVAEQGLLPEHVQFSYKDREYFIRNMGGSVAIDGQPLEADSVVALEHGAKITLDGLEIHFKKLDNV